jgi:hypothetical protein
VADARVLQRLHQADPVGDGHDGLGLEPVARTDVAEVDRLGVVAHRLHVGS